MRKYVKMLNFTLFQKNSESRHFETTFVGVIMDSLYSPVPLSHSRFSL